MLEIATTKMDDLKSFQTAELRDFHAQEPATPPDIV